MVFQHRKNRHGAKPKQPAARTKTTLTDLPDELLLHMLHHATITEVLRLRETSKLFFPACTEVIRDKLKVLYVHPSPSSVQRAIGICKSDLSSEVEEICFLSKSPLFRDGRIDERLRRQWPSRNATSRDIVVGQGACTFDQGYHELLSSLAELGCLQTVSFRESCDRPGLNMLSAQRMTNWVDTTGYQTGHFKGVVSKERKAENTLYAAKIKLMPPWAFSFDDIDALYAILNSEIKFTRLFLPLELLMDTLPHTPIKITRPQTLTRLDLTVFPYWRTCQWHKRCGEVVRSTAATLLELRLGIRHSRWAHRRDSGDSAWSFRQLLKDPDSPMDDIDLPRLQRLELHVPPERGLNSEGPDSVMIQLFDLETFLAHHCKKLRTLHLTDICPILDYAFLVNGHESMRDIQFRLGVPVREIEGLGENTRAWEILGRDE
jgi:hypothetical protein